MASGLGSFSSGLDISYITPQLSRKASPLSNPVVEEKKQLSSDEPEVHIRKIDQVKRIYLTIATYLAFLGCGFSVGIVGPTLAQLEVLFNTDTSGISKAFIGINIGYIIGTLSCALTFDRLNRELQFTVWGIANAVLLASIPWVPDLNYYFIITTFQNMAQGMMFSSSQSYIVKLWQNHKHKGPLVIGCYMAWSTGSFSCPFIAVPFLDDLQPDNPQANQPTTNHSTQLPDPTTVLNQSSQVFNKQLNQVNISNDLDQDLFSGVKKVRIAYGIVGIMNCLTAILFFIAFVFNGPTLRAKNILPLVKQNEEDIKLASENNASLINHKENEQTETLVKTPNRGLLYIKVTMVSLLWLFATFYVWTEYVIGVFISNFTIKELNWSVDQGAIITSVFYGSLGAGRILGLFIAKILIPIRVLAVDICLTAVGTVILLFCKYSNYIVWISVGLIGCAMATIVPSTFIWMSDYVPISGVMSGIYMSGIATGCMVSGYFVGFLFDNYSRMWVVYTCVIFSLLTVIVFIALAVVSKIYHKLKLKLANSKHDSENKINVNGDLELSLKSNKES